jgi:hypothetical protein
MKTGLPGRRFILGDGRKFTHRNLATIACFSPQEIGEQYTRVVLISPEVKEKTAVDELRTKNEKTKREQE